MPVISVSARSLTIDAGLQLQRYNQLFYTDGKLTLPRLSPVWAIG